MNYVPFNIPTLKSWPPSTSICDRFWRQGLYKRWLTGSPNPVCGLPGGTSGEDPACQCRRPMRSGLDPWVRKIPWRRKWQPTPDLLPGELWTEKPGGLQCTGQQRVGPDWAQHIIDLVWRCSVHTSLPGSEGSVMPPWPTQRKASGIGKEGEGRGLELKRPRRCRNLSWRGRTHTILTE